MKQCIKCKQNKSLLEFRKRPSSKDGLRNECRDCLAAHSREWRRKNPQYQLDYDTRRRPQRPKKEERSWEAKISYRKLKKNQCESCNFVAIDLCQLDIDHIDGNHLNNADSNIQTLCANCHRLKTKINREGLYKPKLKIVGGIA